MHERFDDLDTQYDIGDIDLHISGCINSCGHHHSGHIGILGVDKDGSEWYQVTVAGSDGSTLSGPATAGKVIGPSFAADEVPDVIEALVEVYRNRREPGERFIDTARRLGTQPFRARPMRCAAPPPGRPRRLSLTMEFISLHDTTAGTCWPARTARRPPRTPAHALLTLEQWHAVREHWPADLPTGVVLSNSADVSALAVDLPRLALVVLQFPEVDRRPRLLTGPAAARPAPLRRATCAPLATCWSTCCRCCNAPAFPVRSCAPTRRSTAPAARCASSAATTRATRSKAQPLFHREAAWPCRRHTPTARKSAGHEQRVAHALLLLRKAADATTAASCRPPAWAWKAWSSPTSSPATSCPSWWPRWTPARCTRRRWR
jgi:hypothetical protein